MNKGTDSFFLVVESNQFLPNCEWPYVERIVFGCEDHDGVRKVSLVETRDQNKAQGGHNLKFFKAWFPDRVFDLEPRELSQL